MAEAKEVAEALPSVFAALNTYCSLVCGVSQFGPVTVKACILDHGCTSLLLPWPDDPNKELGIFFEGPESAVRYSVRVTTSNAVGSQHATVCVKANLGVFSVVLEGLKVTEVAELRFVLTEPARVWLDQRQVAALPKKGDRKIHEENLEYALVGQSVLARVASIQIGAEGMLIYSLADFLRTPSPTELVALCKRKQAEVVESDYFQKYLKDLRERSHEDATDRRRSLEHTLGRRIDTFGLGFRG